MSEIALRSLLPQAAIPHAALGHAGSALRMEALPEGHVLQLLTASGIEDPSGRLAALGDGGAFALRPLSPGQWFVVGNASLGAAALAAKKAEIAEVAALSDQSHGRVRIALSGPAAETVLACGTAVDISLTAFPVGRSAQTLFGHLGIHLTRTGEDAFELMVLRSFAESLWEELEQLGKRWFQPAGHHR